MPRDLVSYYGAVENSLFGILKLFSHSWFSIVIHSLYRKIFHHLYNSDMSLYSRRPYNDPNQGRTAWGGSTRKRGIGGGLIIAVVLAGFAL